MNNWKIVSKIANLSGAVFAIFSAVTALINYEYFTSLYVSAVPAKLLAFSVITAIVPYVVAAVASFTVAAVVSRAIWQEENEKLEADKGKEEEAKEQPNIDDTAVS